MEESFYTASRIRIIFKGYFALWSVAVKEQAWERTRSPPGFWFGHKFWQGLMKLSPGELFFWNSWWKITGVKYKIIGEIDIFFQNFPGLKNFLKNHRAVIFDRFSRSGIHRGGSHRGSEAEGFKSLTSIINIHYWLT